MTAPPPNPPLPHRDPARGAEGLPGGDEPHGLRQAPDRFRATADRPATGDGGGQSGEGERYGEVELERHRKEDGRALILYEWRP
ncbi:MAG TPA: hypothetical protein VMG62_06095 [Solirubrobacteraceae bacterium]|nr:hypothetical protein [Solirubrobacteraceae bacterium]